VSMWVVMREGESGENVFFSFFYLLARQSTKSIIISNKSEHKINPN